MEPYRSDDAGWMAVQGDPMLYDLDWDNVEEPGNAKQKCLAAREVQEGDE